MQNSGVSVADAGDTLIIGICYPEGVADDHPTSGGTKDLLLSASEVASQTKTLAGKPVLLEHGAGEMGDTPIGVIERAGVDKRGRAIVEMRLKASDPRLARVLGEARAGRLHLSPGQRFTVDKGSMSVVRKDINEVSLVAEPEMKEARIVWVDPASEAAIVYRDAIREAFSMLSGYKSAENAPPHETGSKERASGSAAAGETKKENTFRTEDRREENISPKTTTITLESMSSSSTASEGGGAGAATSSEAKPAAATTAATPAAPSISSAPADVTSSVKAMAAPTSGGASSNQYLIDHMAAQQAEIERLKAVEAAYRKREEEERRAAEEKQKAEREVRVREAEKIIIKLYEQMEAEHKQEGKDMPAKAKELFEEMKRDPNLAVSFQPMFELFAQSSAKKETMLASRNSEFHDLKAKWEADRAVLEAVEKARNDGVLRNRYMTAAQQIDASAVPAWSLSGWAKGQASASHGTWQQQQQQQQQQQPAAAHTPTLSQAQQQQQQQQQAAPPTVSSVFSSGGQQASQPSTAAIVASTLMFPSAWGLSESASASEDNKHAPGGVWVQRPSHMPADMRPLPFKLTPEVDFITRLVTETPRLSGPDNFKIEGITGYEYAKPADGAQLSEEKEGAQFFDFDGGVIRASQRRKVL